MALKRWAIRTLRLILDRADEWLHAQEVRIRDEAARPAYVAEVDPAASATREKEFRGRRLSTQLADGRAAQEPREIGHVRREARTPFTSIPRRPRKLMPRLRYESGQFVRREA